MLIIYLVVFVMGRIVGVERKDDFTEECDDLVVEKVIQT